MTTRRATAASIGLVIAVVVAFVLSAGSASATLPGGGGGGESISCQVSNRKLTLNQVGITSITEGCVGNVAQFSVYIPGSSTFDCHTVGYQAHVFDSTGKDWYNNDNSPFCGDGGTHVSTYSAGYANIVMGVELDITDGAYLCPYCHPAVTKSTLPTTAYVTITILKN
jgi:hypothetical protein